MTTGTAAPALEPGAWQLDPVHSRVGFAISCLAGTFHGSFAPFEATLTVDKNGMATLSGLAKVESVQVQDETSARASRHRVLRHRAGARDHLRVRGTFSQTARSSP